MEKCRNCDAPLNGLRFCSECGADSQAKKFSNDKDLVAENKRLRDRIKELETPPAPPEPPAPARKEDLIG